MVKNSLILVKLTKNIIFYIKKDLRLVIYACKIRG